MIVRQTLPGTPERRSPGPGSDKTLRRELERRSSAVTLSDLEMAVFPELMYALVLANIMSPIIWRWRDDPWFDGIGSMKPYRRILRLKQYIMDNYAFHLDLNTWGLTTKERELARFRGFIPEHDLKRLSPFFGCEGDRYYFQTDVRTEFGLSGFERNVIPYWKTETVEAMDAFRCKPGFSTGAGECVSLAALYAAALFVVARIPLQDMYVIVTPLHCQVFVDVDDGFLTNNRRVITKKMWFNGTSLSGRARRALENERITTVAHETGWVHAVYDWSTMDEAAYRRFADRLQRYLTAPLTAELFGNFLRRRSDLQRCFQLRCGWRGAVCYLPLERAFEAEHGGPFQVSDHTRSRLLATLPVSQFRTNPIPKRLILDDVEDFLRQAKIDLDCREDAVKLKHHLASQGLDAGEVVGSLARFCRTIPRLPELATRALSSAHTPVKLGIEMDRREITARLLDIRSNNELADMAFYAYRDLNRTDAAPFVLAAVERNPVSIRGVARMFGRSAAQCVPEDLLRYLHDMPATSIYAGAGRLAQPDEVWNFGRGDGAEKALLLATILRSRNSTAELTVEVSSNRAVLQTPWGAYEFSSRKGLAEQRWAIPVTREERA